MLLYGPTLFFDFLNWDDIYYVVKNPLIHSLNITTLFEIFKPTTYVMGNYHPLTILSYSIDYQIYEINPTGYHATNVLLHILNTFLFFHFLSLFIQNKNLRLFLALVFCIHPIQNESVAWISDRKDLLATSFGLAFLNTWISGLLKRNFWFYVQVILLFILALLSKATMVVLAPIAFLYLIFFSAKSLKKISLLVCLVFFFSFAFWIGQLALHAQEWQYIQETNIHTTFLERVSFSGYAIGNYILKLIIPYPLSAFYPYPKSSLLYLIPWILLICSIFYLLYKHKFNTLFFLLIAILALLPVLQLKPVGNAIIANRYLYFPSIAIFTGLGLFLQKRQISNKIYAVILLVFMSISWLNLNSWKNSISLWTNTLQQYPELSMAYLNRGDAYEQAGNIDKAKSDFKLAIAFEQLPMAYIRKAQLENTSDAIQTLEYCLQQHPTYEIAHNNIALLYKKQGDVKQAIFHLQQAIVYSPSYADAYSNIGNIYAMQGNYDLAKEYYQKAVTLEPENEVFIRNLEALLTKQTIP